MVNIKIIKQYFSVIALVVFFNATVFANTNIVTIAHNMNKYFDTVKNLAYIEYKSQQAIADDDFKAMINSLLKVQIYDITTDKISISAAQIDEFAKRLIDVSNNFRKSVIISCYEGRYENTNKLSDKKINLTMVAIAYEGLLINIIVALCENITFSKDQFQEFTVELNNIYLSNIDKENIFEALIKIKN
jgi:hypothetical protein